MFKRSGGWRRRGKGSSGKAKDSFPPLLDASEPARKAARPRWSWLAFRPTHPGSRFLLLLLVMGFAAYNTRNNLLYLMFSVSFATVLASLVAGWLSLKWLMLDKGRPEDLYAGTVSSEHFRLRNPSRWLEVYGVDVEDLDFPGPSPKASLPHLGRGESAAFVLEKTYPHRGIFTSHRMRLSTEFPFGLLRIARKFRLERRVIVFPHVHRVNISFVFRQRLGQVPARQRRGESEELRSIRSYMVGDGFHHIHWKATAKTGELMVREFASSQKRGFTVIFDNQSVSGDDKKASENDFESLVSLVASVASHLSSHRLPYRLVSTDEVLPYGFGLEHLRGIMTYLALTEPRSESKVDIPDWVGESLAKGDIVLVLSSRPSEEWASLTSEGLHFIEPKVLMTEGGTARAS